MLVVEGVHPRRHAPSADIASAPAVMNDPRPAWEVSIDVSAFVTANVTPCDDDLDTEYPKLAPPTDKTLALWRLCERLLAEERRNGGVSSCDPRTPAKATSHPPGYIDDGTMDNVVVGLQTDVPLRRAMKPLGGIREQLSSDPPSLEPEPEKKPTTDERRTRFFLGLHSRPVRNPEPYPYSTT